MRLARTNVFLSVAPGFVGNDRGLKKPDNHQHDEKRNAPGNNIVMLSEKKKRQKNQSHNRSKKQNHDKSLT
ncbi:hypothetical protein A0R60_3171 [Enterobacter asburiae]|nr:hypothetical protein A0R60_3171 [Enterobacter asburiae]